MGDEATTGVRHERIAGLAQLGPGDLFHKVVDFHDNGNTAEKFPILTNYRGTHWHNRVPAYS